MIHFGSIFWPPGPAGWRPCSLGLGCQPMVTVALNRLHIHSSCLEVIFFLPFISSLSYLVLAGWQCGCWCKILKTTHWPPVQFKPGQTIGQDWIFPGKQPLCLWLLLRWLIGSMSHTANLFSTSLSRHLCGLVSRACCWERLRIFQIMKSIFPFFFFF